MSSQSRGTSVRTLKAKVFWVRSRRSRRPVCFFNKGQQARVNSYQLLALIHPRRTLEKKHKAAAELREVQVLVTGQLIPTRGPTTPGRPTGPLLPLAPCGEPSPHQFQDVLRYLMRVFRKAREGAHSRGIQLSPVHPEGRLYREFPGGTREILVLLLLIFHTDSSKRVTRYDGCCSSAGFSTHIQAIGSNSLQHRTKNQSVSQSDPAQQLLVTQWAHSFVSSFSLNGANVCYVNLQV